MVRDRAYQDKFSQQSNRLYLTLQVHTVLGVVVFVKQNQS
jgi:hypothetical protein